MDVEQIQPGKYYTTVYSTTMKCLKIIRAPLVLPGEDKARLQCVEFVCPTGIRHLQPQLIDREASKLEFEITQKRLADAQLI